MKLINATFLILLRLHCRQGLLSIQTDYVSIAKELFGPRILRTDKNHQHNHAPELAFWHGSGPYHSANNSERAHKITQLLYSFLSNKRPDNLTRQIAQATDDILAVLVLKDLECKHPFGLRIIEKTQPERSATTLMAPRHVIHLQLDVDPISFKVVGAFSTVVDSSSLKLEHMYWALLQHLADCYPIPDGSLPPCVHCHQHHDPNNCPHFRANLDQPFNKTPDNTLRLGIGLNLSEKLKAQEGSRSYIYCKPWKQVLNFAVVDSGTDEPWIGQLQLIFTCSLASGDNMDLAYVKWLAVDTVCATGCSSDDALADELMDDQFVRYKWATSLMGLKRRSRPPEQEVSHSVIELSSIISHAAITTAGDGQTFLYKK